MSVRSFGSVYMVGGVAAAALGCYLVSLRVASERAALESVENEIVLAQRDIRLLQTEIGTRGRLAQLERWNVKVLALSAPSADQFIPDSFQLARLASPERRLDVEAPVVYASAPAAPSAGVLPVGDDQDSGSAPAAKLMHEASLKLPPQRATARKIAPPKPATPPTTTAKPRQPTARPVQIATATTKKAVIRPAQSAIPTTRKPAADSVKASPAPTRLAQSDPLAPLPSGKKKSVPATTSTSKDSGQTR